MNILAIDTTADELRLILVQDKTTRIETCAQIRRHNEILLPAVERLLTQSALTLFDIDYFGVCVGPGSFTGIRLGINTVNAFAYATGKKIAAFTVFDVLSYNVENYLAAVESGHGMYYGEKKGNDGIVWREFSQEELEKETLPVLTEYRLENVALAVKKKIESGEVLEKAEPYYLKKSQPERLADENKKGL